MQFYNLCRARQIDDAAKLIQKILSLKVIITEYGYLKYLITPLLQSGDCLTGLLYNIFYFPDSEHTLWERVRLHRKFAGAVMGTMDAWLLCRGLRTLFLRVSKQADNAIIIACYLETHPAIEKVYYPRLKNDPGHEIAVRQIRGGFGGMISVLVPGGRKEAIEVVKRARVFKRATSLVWCRKSDRTQKDE